MLREMQEIKDLAIKYSKADLGRMVQLNLLDPQKAMMAGMMIQRIEQQNAKPPQTTAIQDVLGLPAVAAAQPAQPQMAQAPQPQMPPQGAPAPQPTMMAAEGGLTTIPADNIGEYAGGGIVAFDEGGEVPGYATGGTPPGLFDALVQAESRGKQSAVSSKGARGVAQLMPGTMRDPGYGITPVKDDSEEENRRVGREYLSVMLKKYKGNIDNALAAYNWGPGNVDKHLRKYGELTPEKLPKETRNYIPKVKNFLAQQERGRSEPTRVAAREATDGVMDMPALRSRSGVPSLLRGPLERITNLLPSAGAEEFSEATMDVPAGRMMQANYAEGGIASFKDGGLDMPVDLQTPFDMSGGNRTVYGTTTTDAFRPTSEAEPTSSVFGRMFSGVLEGPSGARERYSAQQGVLERQRALRMRLQQLEGYGFAQQTRAQQAEAEQIRKELSALEGQLRTAARTQTAAPPQSAVPAAGIRAEPPQTQAYPVKGGFETVAPDQFPLQSATEMGARRREGFAPAQNLPPVAGAPEAEGGKPTPSMPNIAPPNLKGTSFEDYVARTTPKVGKLDVTQTKDLKTLGAERRQAEVDEGLDPDMFSKIIKGIEEKKGKAASEKDAALGLGIMKAGFKLMGSRKGQEFQTLSEGAQEGLNDYAKAVERVKDRQDKYDERIEQLRMADAQAKRTGLQSDIARRDRLEERAQVDKTALFNAENAAANAGVQAAATLSSNDQNRLVDIWKTEKTTGAQKYAVDMQAKVQSELNEVYRMGMLQANQAKIVMDAANDFIAKNAALPAYMKDPAKLKNDAVAYAYEMAGNLGILPKGATVPQPRQFTKDELNRMYNLQPVK
jgi:soluble lytic murein transglycosylase-like protein